MVDKYKAVICCLLATSAIMLSENKKRKHKMWCKKWYLKRNISRDAHHFGSLRALRWCHRGVGRWTEETVGFPEWNAQFSVWKTTGKDSSEAWTIACHNCTVYEVFSSGMTSHNNIAQFNWECIGRFRSCGFWVLLDSLQLKYSYFLAVQNMVEDELHSWTLHQ